MFNLKRVAFTMAGAGQAAPIFGLMARRIAFTMAEILLSLTIIGVVAAITLPSLTGNINERTWNTQRKALYSRLSQAVSLLPSIKGYAPPEQVTSYYYLSENGAEAFLSKGLSSVLKINNICDSEHLSDCGLADKIKDFSGGDVSLTALKNLTDYYSYASATGCGNNFMVDSKVAAFETVNGESLLVQYNPMCMPNDSSSYSNVMVNLCVNFIYDLNGKKGPNTIGKDMGFMTLYYPLDSALVAPMPLVEEVDSLDFNTARSYCKSMDGARLPNKEELMSIGFNRMVLGANFLGGEYWSSTPGSNHYVSNGYWAMSANTNRGQVWPTDPSSKYIARCVRSVK